MAVYVVASRFEGDRFVACDSEGTDSNDVFHVPVETWLPANIYRALVSEWRRQEPDMDGFYRIDFGSACNAALRELYEIDKFQGGTCFQDGPCHTGTELRFTAVEAPSASEAEEICHDYMIYCINAHAIVGDFILEAGNSMRSHSVVLPVRMEK